MPVPRLRCGVAVPLWFPVTLQLMVDLGVMFAPAHAQGRVWKVLAAAPERGDGSAERPFRTISQAADLAMPGDEIIVGPGLYRE